MATDSSASKVRIIVLVIVLAAVAAAGVYRSQNGGFGGGASAAETAVINGELLGKHLEDATKVLGVQPVEQPNPDAATSTAKLYRYTIPGAKPDRQFVRIRVAADGRIVASKFIDESGNDIIIDSK
jgi:hypothetical protein